MGLPIRHGYRCPCCGFFGLNGQPNERLIDPTLARRLQPPYCTHFGCPSYELCPCCGFEYGFDDEPGSGAGVSFEDYLSEWVNNGCAWFIPSQQPSGWSLKTQLIESGLESPDTQ